MMRFNDDGDSNNSSGYNNEVNVTLMASTFFHKNVVVAT